MNKLPPINLSPYNHFLLFNIADFSEWFFMIYVKINFCLFVNGCSLYSWSCTQDKWCEPLSRTKYLWKSDWIRRITFFKHVRTIIYQFRQGKLEKKSSFFRYKNWNIIVLSFYFLIQLLLCIYVWSETRQQILIYYRLKK